jgi:hypothetical protein
MENIIGKRVWITKYALTTGLFSGVVRDIADGDPNYVFLQDQNYSVYHLGKDCFLTESEAKELAKIMRDKKIKSLEKQIKKLKQMEF